MTNFGFYAALLVVAALAGSAPQQAIAQPQFQVITGAEFDAAAPNTVNVEKMSFPVQKRNAVLLQSPSGSRAFLALTDCTGYSSDVAAKYSGAIITQKGSLSIGGKAFAPGTYAFGLAVPPGKFAFYSQAGAKIGEVPAQYDANLPAPRPLQVVLLKDGTARLYLGRHSVELR